VKFSSSEILPAAESTGFKAEMVEKVLHLLNLLNALNSHPFLKGRTDPRSSRQSKRCFHEKGSPSRECRTNTQAGSGG